MMHSSESGASKKRDSLLWRGLFGVALLGLAVFFGGNLGYERTVLAMAWGGLLAAAILLVERPGWTRQVVGIVIFFAGPVLPIALWSWWWAVPAFQSGLACFALTNFFKRAPSAIEAPRVHPPNDPRSAAMAQGDDESATEK